MAEPVEIRLGDIPGLTKEEKENLEKAARVIADYATERVKSELPKPLTSEDVERIVQKAFSDTLQAKLPGAGNEKARLHEWAGKYFAAAMNGARPTELSELNKQFSDIKFKAVVTTGSTGMSNVLPVGVVDEVDAYARNIAWELQTLRVIPVNTLTGYFPVGTDTRCTTYIVSQGAAPTDSAPTMAGHSWSLLRFAAVLPLSRQLISYSVPAFLQYMIEELAYSKAVKVASQFAVGTDSSQWQGLETASISQVTNESSSLLIDLLDSLFCAVPVFHRGRAIWVMNSTTYAAIRQAKDGDGRRVFGVNEQVDTLFGRPIRVNEYLTDGRVYFGDPTRYHIYEGGGVEITRVDTGYTPLTTDSVYFAFSWDADGGVSDVNAWRYCQIA